jgi:AraC-like DNA-binding protein
VNRGFLLNFALNAATDVVGNTDFDLEPDYIATQFRLDDERVLAGEAIRDRIELVGRYDHTAVWCVTNKVPLRDVRGCIIATAGITRPLATDERLPAHRDTAIGRVIERFRQGIAEPLENVALAKLAGLSVRTFERRFRQLFQISPQHYLRRLRVRLACQALVYSENGLAEIAMSHGFCDQSHFGREFRRETGMSPGAYREQFRSEKH